jgi:hypothetical protein
MEIRLCSRLSLEVLLGQTLSTLDDVDQSFTGLLVQRTQLNGKYNRLYTFRHFPIEMYGSNKNCLFSVPL